MSDFVVLPNDVVQIDREAGDSCIYGVDFAGRLESGDTVSNSSTVAAIGGASITVGSSAVSGTIVKSRISGAASGTNLGVLFTCITGGGDTFTRPIFFNTL